eukprot:4658183-Pleurochrysis_carterae.AAC.1
MALSLIPRLFKRHVVRAFQRSPGAAAVCRALIAMRDGAAVDLIEKCVVDCAYLQHRPHNDKNCFSNRTLKVMSNTDTSDP